MIVGTRLLWIGCYGLLAIWWGQHGREPALIALLIGAVATALCWTSWSWTASLRLLVALTGAGLGVAAGLTPWGMLIVVVLALAAWDLELFARRLERFSESDPRMWRQHVRVLGWALALGGGAGALALGARVTFAFGWALFLAVLFLILFLLLVRAPLAKR
ncbi:MAG: hypothetical protein NZ610_07775 [Candidatus Bipolaricaulota bacterium]|nr:hypothetical protein [Candidatus Bipolaricaulota bacterium]MCS7275278.1 hypothetical protein [Candidatus Bipolaricaulota bacterium]MDW8111542.1 hypothetical protein [Candidatus Bipolaricaulota bacterium]MDW8329430.1 hypothetical protein [Candidatus Bipolaricaulota bacterium]